MAGLPLGIYTVTFKPLANVYMPAYQAQALYADQTLQFNGSYVPDTVPPTGMVVIDNSEYASVRSIVGLTLDFTDEVAGMDGAQMKFSNDGATWSTAEPYATVKAEWDLTAFGGEPTPGVKTVYAMVADAFGNWGTYTASILYVPFRQILEVPMQYSTIQAALDAALPGDIVHVGPGTYSGDLTLRDGVTLQGAGSNLTFLQGFAYIHTAANTEIHGFCLTNVEIIASAGPTIICNNSFQISVASRWGVEAGSGAQVFVRNNLFTGSGIIVQSSTSLTAENNTFVNSTLYPAVFLNHSAPGTKVILRDNIFAFNRSGVVECSPTDKARQHVFTSFNTFWNNTYGNFGESETTWTPTNLGQGMSSGDVNADPLFVDRTHDNFQTQTTSPVVNSGDPDPRFNDPNGTRDDRGAFGGPGATFAPVAAFNALPSTGSVGSIFTFDASKSFDPTGGGVLARWDFNGDGVWDTPFSPLLVVSQRMDTIGTFAVKLEVQNQYCAQTDITGQIVVQNQNPDAPRSPSVADGGVTVASNTILSWKGGDPDPLDTVSYDVYFGSTAQPPLVSTDQPDTVFTTQSLAPGVYYYWRVVSRDNHGAVTPGPLWSFLTVQALVVSTATLSVAEGGTNTFTVKLAAQPTSDVTVSVARQSGDADLTVSGGASLTFTSTNWNATQTVTLAAAEDADAANGSATITVASAGLTSVNVTANEADNDVAGVTVSPTSGLVTTEAGGTTTFTVTLTSQPSGNVTIPLSSSDPTEGTVPASVVISPTQWQTGVQVTVTGVDDPIIDGNVAYTIVTGAASGADANYNGLNAADVSVTN
ncbi:MAG: hypothetical protein NTY19_23450, partial [Planctomycetota bacterium]|nr:hypothetical protein [Planctomycetota bacterium]